MRAMMTGMINNIISSYFRLNRLMKVFVLLSLSIVSLLFNMFAGLLFFGDPLEDILGIWVVLMINQGAMIALTALLIECIQAQEYMHKSLLKHEKMVTVSHFAASVSHELRNPLQSIKGFIQLMKEYKYSRSVSNSHKHRHQINQQPPLWRLLVYLMCHLMNIWENRLFF